MTSSRWSSLVTLSDRRVQAHAIASYADLATTQKIRTWSRRRGSVLGARPVPGEHEAELTRLISSTGADEQLGDLTRDEEMPSTRTDAKTFVDLRRLALECPRLA